MRQIVSKPHVSVVVVILLGWAGSVWAADAQVNQQAIEEVRSGRCKVARAAWWGFNEDDATQALQAAIDSGVEKVVVEKMPGPWIVDKIDLAGDQEILFEPGVEVLAKEGAFHGGGDALFTAQGKTDIKLTGPGAALRIRRADYDSSKYKKAEWRHVLNVHGCTNVTVTGLTLAESGGDGIYLGAGPQGEPNRNVVIRDVVCDRNYRQGISVITVENLLIENCVLKDTAGTAPAAGIDFEPNAATERLVNCVMRKCMIENNQGYAVHIYARPLNGSSAPISIRIEDCVTRGTNARSASIITGCGDAGAVKGQIEFVDCRFEDAGKAGINIGSKPSDGVRLKFDHCTLADPSDHPTSAAPILFSMHTGDLGSAGGVRFIDFTLRERTERALMKFDDAIGARLLDVTGTLIVERPDRRTVHTLDQTLIDQWIPYDPINAIKPISLESLRLEPVRGGLLPAGSQLPGHRLRGEAAYLVYVTKGEAVSLRMAYEPVGQYEGKPLAVRVLSPTDKEIQRFTIEFRQEGACDFTADQDGTFMVICQPGQNTARMISCSHPVSVTGNQGRITVLGTTGDFYFSVPPGGKEFGLRIRGEGEGERVSAAVFDSTDRKLWDQANIGTPQSFCTQREASAQGEVWRLRLSRPMIGILEDTCVELRGLPPVLGFDPDRLLRPVPVKAGP